MSEIPKPAIGRYAEGITISMAAVNTACKNLEKTMRILKKAIYHARGNTKSPIRYERRKQHGARRGVYLKVKKS